MKSYISNHPRLVVGKPRDVVFLTSLAELNKTGVKISGTAGSRFLLVKKKIEAGEDVEDTFYSPVTLGGTDGLYKALGITHFHLDGDMLLFVRQYDDHVLFIEINTHLPFDLGAIEYFKSYISAIGTLEYERERDARMRVASIKAAVKNLKKRDK